MGLLATNGFNGQYDEEPFAFGKFGVEWVKQIWNGDLECRIILLKDCLSAKEIISRILSNSITAAFGLSTM